MVVYVVMDECCGSCGKVQAVFELERQAQEYIDRTHNTDGLHIEEWNVINLKGEDK